LQNPNGEIDYADHLEEFQRFLDENLGKAGQTLANSVAKRFYGKLGWIFESIPHHDLVDYVHLAPKRGGKPTLRVLVAEAKSNASPSGIVERSMRPLIPS